MHVLLVEDDCYFGSLSKIILEREKMVVDWLKCGEVAIGNIIGEYDIIIIDWTDINGLEICSGLRRKGYKGGIIMLTCKDELRDRVRCLDAGADDYLIKPFEFIELLARIRALKRRVDFHRPDNTLRVGELEIDLSDHTIKKSGREIQLTYNEFGVLELLATYIGQVVSRDLIKNRVWGIESNISSNNLDAYIRLLRRKLDQLGEKYLIQNVRGIGYRLYPKVH